MLNIVTALVTEADKPATIAKLQRSNTIINIFIYFPNLTYSIGLKMKFKSNRIIPTCSPETAKICMTPA